MNDSDANETVLAPFYGGSFNILSASGRKVFAEGEQQVAFSAVRFSFCSGKQLARKREKTPPELVLFRRAADREGIGIFRSRQGFGLSLKL